MEVAENHVNIAPDRDDGLVIRMFSRASDKSLKARKSILVKRLRVPVITTCINAAKIQARSVKISATKSPMWILWRRHLISLQILTL